MNLKQDYTNKFPTGSVVQHTKGGKYTIINIPSTNVLLEYNREPFYLYQCNKTSTVFARCKTEMEDGRFMEVKRPERKLSIQKKGKTFRAGMFIGFDCVRDFRDYDTEELAKEDARFHFQCNDFDIVRPKITSMKTTMIRK